jgi:DNA-binding transcriptional regulator YhcF (GntR family)
MDMSRGPRTPAIRIDLESNIPVARQVADAIRALLVGGALAPGSKMPTVRRLAIDLGVNHNTIAAAYRALAAEGWLDLRRRRGAIVIERVTPRPNARVRVRFTRRLKELVAEVYSAGLSPIQIETELLDISRRLRPSGRKG